MIVGKVAENLDLTVELILRLPDGSDLNIFAVIDTGFSGEFLAPRKWLENLGYPMIDSSRGMMADGNIVEMPRYEVTMIWNGHEKLVEACGVDGDFLVGIRLLQGSRLSVEVRPNGEIEIESL